MLSRAGGTPEHRGDRFEVLHGLLGGYHIYQDFFDTAMQKEKSFPEVISLEISPKGLPIQGFLS